MAETITHKLDKYTMQLLQEAFSRNWKQQHKGEFCENQVPKYSNSGLINHALCYYIGCFGTDTQEHYTDVANDLSREIQEAIT